MANIESITLLVNGQNRYSVKAEEIYVYNSVRLSHGDKMFPDLIDSLGISADYNIDPVTNNISPGSLSRWYFFAIPLFSDGYIPWKILTEAGQCVIEVKLKSNSFILPSSPGTYADLELYSSKLIAHQLILTPEHYASILKNPYTYSRINDTKKSTIIQLSNTSLLNDAVQSVKISSAPGPCCMFLIGLRERNNPFAFASYLPINNVAIERRDTTTVKNQSFNTEILKTLNAFENNTGEFFLKKELVCYSFDALMDAIILTNYHGGWEVMEDEYFAKFTVGKSLVGSAKDI
jgi:hypothetical protein